MKKTWMLWAAVLSAGILWSGCFSQEPDSTIWKRSSASPPSNEQTASADTTATEPPTPSETQNESGPVEPMDNRIASFVARFPPDDRDRQAGTEAPDAPQPQAEPQTFVPPTPPQPETSQRPADVAVHTTDATDTQPATMELTGPSAAVEMGPPETLVQIPATPAPVTEPKPEPTLETPSTDEPPIEPQAPFTATDDAPPAPVLNVRVVNVTAAPSHPVENGNPQIAAANTAVDRPTAPAPDSLVDMIQRLERRVQHNPQQLDDQFKLRMAYLLADQTDKVAAPIEGTDPVQGELMIAVFRAMMATRSICTAPQQSANEALSAANELQRLIGQQAAVMIPRTVLVTRVNSFGDYQAVNPPRFSAGRPVHVFLYTEVVNFRYQPTADGRLHSEMSEEVEIFDADGQSVWKQNAEKIEETVLHPRRDFFIPFEIMLPADTPAGQYVIKVTIEDKIGLTTDQQRLTFTIE